MQSCPLRGEVSSACKDAQEAMQAAEGAFASRCLRPHGHEARGPCTELSLQLCFGLAL